MADHDQFDEMEEFLKQVQAIDLLKADQSFLLVALLEWNIDSHRLVTGRRRIGSGGAASVFKGRYHGHHVAVKMFNIKEEEEEESQLSEEDKMILSRDIFLKEVSIWCTLDHPNVTKFMGANIRESVKGGMKEGMFELVTEFLPGGTLRSLITKNHQRRRKLPFRTVLRLAYDLATGLGYLHSKRIVHRDIKPENLLLDSHGRLKIADFGVSCVEAADPSEMTAKIGTLSYMAPEVLKSEPYNRKCDIYSFGICLWEMYCCEFPYDQNNMSLWEMSSMVAGLKLRPHIPYGCPKELADLMQKCWDSDPSKRPEMNHVVTLLADLMCTRARSHSLFACLS